jgi:putative hydrolase
VSPALLDLGEDAHCHTARSDDAHDPLADVVAAAEARGLTRLSLTDHVRASTTWLPEYVAELRRAAGRTDVRLVPGVEAKILDTTGRVDVPPDLAGIEQVTISDHQFPAEDGPVRPDDVRRELASGGLTPATALEQLVAATAHAVRRYDAPVVGHLFSILPKIGVPQELVTDASLEELAAACRSVDAAVEVNEKWSTPSSATVARLVALGVRLVPGSDAHCAADVGRWSYVAEVARAGSGP